ncbi:unnamed protein product [Rhizophagus irregularis]|nr:unnamed protein product [Rhizophagus irregularis]CAB5369319.1 unnamed protein product [Rhizophagus irregularis]
MALLNKSFIIITILVACMLADVFAVKVDTNNKDVCKKSDLDIAKGDQNKDGSCSQTFMGEIPDSDTMISTLIRFPGNNEVIRENEPFTIKTETTNLDTGFFSDPAKTYYKFPQTLDNSGRVQGHSHVTIQKLNGRGVPDPKVFAFFKGLNEKAKNGILSADVEKGLPAGNYRLCTITSAFSHQPVLMPVAQRGAQDDCVRFKVIKKKKNRKM